MPPSSGTANDFWRARPGSHSGLALPTIIGPIPSPLAPPAVPVPRTCRGTSRGGRPTSRNTSRGISRAPPPSPSVPSATRTVEEGPRGIFSNGGGFAFGPSHDARATEHPKGDGPPARLVSLGTVRGAPALQVAWNLPRATVFAATRAKGDVFGPDSVSLAPPRGARSPHVPRDLPRGTADVAEHLKGDFPSAAPVPLVAAYSKYAAAPQGFTRRPRPALPRHSSVFPRA